MKNSRQEQYKVELPRLKAEKRLLIEERRKVKYNLNHIEVNLRNVIRKIKTREEVLSKN